MRHSRGDVRFLSVQCCVELRHTGPMKIEAEVEHSGAYAFDAVEAGGGGCCAEASPAAQERSSIGRPEWQQQQPPGCGGCGPSSDNNTGGPTSVFDCEHFQFIDDDDEEDEQAERVVICCENVPATEAPTGQGEAEASCSSRFPRDDAELSNRQQRDDEMGDKLRSVLKKGAATKRHPKNRVTFDEAVTLYSDDDVQMLALTTGPDIVYTDVFYMFEPPIEYQDVPPFEPPAEYRDSDEATTTCEPPPPDEACAVQQSVDPEEEAVTTDDTSSEPPPPPVEVATPDPGENISDVAVSAETESTDSAADEMTPTTSTATTQSDSDPSESTLESDKLFERFLEAEREFAVDEELNSVFHALETDFANDDKNGALDDNFFRKLISLLSSAEGESSEVTVNDYFSDTPHFSRLQDVEDDDNSQAHSRTLSEADSDCSISSQDTIIVRFGEDENEPTSSAGDSSSASLLFAAKPDDVPDDLHHPHPSAGGEGFDDVFAEDEKAPRPLPRESLLAKNSNHVVAQAVAKIESGESLSRQSSGEQSVNSQDQPQDADDSTSSDSRSGEVEEEIRLDDIGYDEEDAEDYDEESFRGMAHGNSKIRRIIKKNALQCTLFRGIDTKRRQQPGAKYPRPKSPLLSQESLVEKLKWLTTIDEQQHKDEQQKFLSKPPDVILSTGGVPVNGSIPHSASSEDDQATPFQQPFYPMQQQPRHVLPPNSSKATAYYVRRDGFPPTHHPSLPRQRVAFAAPPQAMHNTLPYTQNRVVAHPSQVQQQQQQQRPIASMTVPRNFRDWRIIQRITGNRGGEGGARVAADYVRCPGVAAYPVGRPPPAANKDELEQFVEKDSKRMDMIRKRYSVAEEEDDPTFGFARRPSVRGVQNRIQSNPSENVPHGTATAKAAADPYAPFEEVPLARYDPGGARVWRPPEQQPPLYGGRPMHIHRASVALTELPGNATIPYAHRKPHPADTRYHSYAESMYGSTRTLPTQGCWLPPPPMLQVPPHSKDERGVPEGASSSPKISSDSLYHAPVPDAIATGGPHKEDGMIYYSLNV